MTEERLKHEGRLVLKELEIKGLRLRIGGMVGSLRELLDPMEKEEELRADMIGELAMQLITTQIDLKAALEDISKLKKILGRQ